MVTFQFGAWKTNFLNEYYKSNHNKFELVYLFRLSQGLRFSQHGFSHPLN